MNKTTIDKKNTFLLKIGFSLKEAKIYLTLLEKYPLNYEKLIDCINKENQTNLLIAKEELKKYSKSNNDEEFIFNIKGFEEFIKKARELILKAKKEISLSIWKNDFELIKDELCKYVASEMKKVVKLYSFTYLIDLTTYGQIYDENVRKVFALGYHSNAMGYYTYALIIGNYIDYIIRANYKDFFELSFVGRTLKNNNVK